MAEMTMNAVQMDLVFSHNRDTLASCFEKETGKTVSVTITDNSTNMISVKTKGDSISLRLHRMFLHAGSEVIQEISAFVKRGKGRTPLIRDFIRKNQDSLENTNRSSRKVATRTRGRYHNLQELFGLVNNQYFGGKIKASISWGRRSRDGP